MYCEFVDTQGFKKGGDNSLSLSLSLSHILFSSLSFSHPPPLTLTQSMFSPASTPYQKLAEECVKYGVGVELFLFPTNYCDVATLGDFVSTTGGELHYYRGYQVSMK